MRVQNKERDTEMIAKLTRGSIAKLALASLALAILAGGQVPAEAADWPQWMGPNRDGISQESGFSKQWPEEGPRVVWRIKAGRGFSGISIVDGRLYTMYNSENAEFVVCMNADTGEEIWRYQSDDEYLEHEGGDGPRSTDHGVDDSIWREKSVSCAGPFHSMSTSASRAGGHCAGMNALPEDMGNRFRHDTDSSTVRAIAGREKNPCHPIL